MWRVLHPQASFPAPLAAMVGIGVWPYPPVSDSGYNSAPLWALPFGECSLPLGNHLIPATKESIWKGYYVGIFDLLNRKVDAKAMEKEDKVEKER